MTVVLSLATAEGLVIASDSQITDSDRAMSFPAQKLHDLGGRAAWGGSGARAVLNDVQRCFDAEAALILEADNVTHALQERVLPILRHHYEHFIAEVPGEDSAQSPSAYVLAAGYHGDAPWMVEINPNGIASRYEDVGFHAIGSGAAMAQQAGTLLAHFRTTERSLDHGVAAALRVLDALSVTAPSIGGPMAVCRVTPDGSDHLDEGEIDEMRDRIERWRADEQRVFAELF